MQNYDFPVYFESCCRISVNTSLLTAVSGSFAQKVAKVRGSKRDAEVKRGWLMPAAFGAKSHVTLCHSHVSVPLLPHPSRSNVLQYFAFSVAGARVLIDGEDCDAMLNEFPGIVRTVLRNVGRNDVSQKVDDLFVAVCSKVDKFFNHKTWREKENEKPHLHVSFAFCSVSSDDGNPVIKGLSFWDCGSALGLIRSSTNAYDVAMALDD
jgi:hypothetical protein